jgi:hypothetical protein
MGQTITPAELREQRCAGKSFELIDVRLPAESKAGHVEFARNLPLDQLTLSLIRHARDRRQ